MLVSPKSPRSSYKNANLTYENVFQTICFLVKPKRIVEYGILDGFSLNSLVKYSSPDCQIIAYDIFDDFVGNHANKEYITDLFRSFPNVCVAKGDFYKHYTQLEDNTIDIIHIDIANTGDTYEFAVDNYLSKLTPNGVLILEGGSTERDQVWWMTKFNKRTVSDFLTQTKATFTVLLPFPSLTIIQKEFKK